MALTVITEEGKYWEYRCAGCDQLRFYPMDHIPEKCGNCDSTDLTVGRPGTLSTEGDQRK